jgi:hypothetical protein
MLCNKILGLSFACTHGVHFCYAVGVRQHCLNSREVFRAGMAQYKYLTKIATSSSEGALGRVVATERCYGQSERIVVSLVRSFLL